MKIFKQKQQIHHVATSKEQATEDRKNINQTNNDKLLFYSRELLSFTLRSRLRFLQQMKIDIKSFLFKIISACFLLS